MTIYRLHRPENKDFGLGGGLVAAANSQVLSEQDCEMIFGVGRDEACLRTRCAYGVEDLQLVLRWHGCSCLVSMMLVEGANRILRRADGALACLSPSKN